MRTYARLLVAAGLIAGGLLADATPALAHNSLTGSDPQDGETVEHAPDRVRLRFLAAVDADNAEFDVAAPDGSSVMADDPKVDENTVRIPLRPGPAGDYEVAWRVLSSDGDWVEGTVAFTVTVGAEPSPSPTPTPVAAGPTPSAAPSATPIASDIEDAAGSGPAWWVWALLALAVAVPAGYLGYRLRRGAGRSS